MTTAAKNFPMNASSRPPHPPVVAPERTTHPAVQEFAAGLDGAPPTASVVAAATALVQAALDHTTGALITYDDTDGLDFHLRLPDGRLVMANLFTDGTTDASIYDDRQGTPSPTVQRMRRTAATTAALMRLFRTGMPAQGCQ